MVKGFFFNNKGWVKIRSLDLIEILEINFNYFVFGFELDMEVMKDIVVWIRMVYFCVGIIIVELLCNVGLDVNGYCGKEDENWIYEWIFGYYFIFINRIGVDNDLLVVLDSKFRVRGVSGLRVVDVSVFVWILGVFFVVLMFMISQKVSDDMLVELKDGQVVKVCVNGVLIL